MNSISVYIYYYFTCTKELQDSSYKKFIMHWRRLGQQQWGQTQCVEDHLWIVLHFSSQIDHAHWNNGLVVTTILVGQVWTKRNIEIYSKFPHTMIFSLIPILQNKTNLSLLLLPTIERTQRRQLVEKSFPWSYSSPPSSHNDSKLIVIINHQNQSWLDSSGRIGQYDTACVCTYRLTLDNNCRLFIPLKHKLVGCMKQLLWQTNN